MIKKSLLFFLVVSCAFAYYDFGVVGNTYDIVEPDAQKEMQKAYEKIDKEALKKEWEKEITKSLIGDITLPSCKKDASYKTNLLNQVASNDIDIPEADIHIKAGTPLAPYYKNVHLKYFLINATSAKEINWIKKQKASNVIISEGDLNEMKDFQEKFILNKTLQDAFNLKCTPSSFEIKDGNLIIKEYEIKEDKK